MKLQDRLRADKNMKRFPPYAVAMFEHCFHLQMEHLPPGARFDTRGKLVYLLEGAGEVGAWDMESGEFFGLSRDGKPEHQVFTSHISCELLLWDDRVLEGPCKGRCWFHEEFCEMVKKAAAGRFYRVGE